MYYYFKGKIVNIGEDYVAIDTNGVAYLTFVSNPSEFTLGEEMTLFAHEVYNENDHYLCGFRSLKDKEAFDALISVKGIGPKTALNALSSTTSEELFSAIENSNISFLKKLPGIGPKAASQIILDLAGKLKKDTAIKHKDDERFADCRAALKSLGFKFKDIDEVLAKIDGDSLSNEEILRVALKALRKGGN